jgi:serine/threonine-protein kinase ATR
VAQVLAILVQYGCRREEAPVVTALLQMLDEGMHASLGQERFLAALGVIARHGCCKLSTVAIAALMEQATLLERRRATAKQGETITSALDRIAWELERTAAPRSVRKLVLERGPELFPLLLDTLLQRRELVTLMQHWLELPDLTAVFACVHRLSFAFLIKRGEASRLRALQQQAQPQGIYAAGPEEQALALAESLLLSSPAQRQRAWALLESTTGTSVEVIARTQCTRVILCLLSEYRDQRQTAMMDAFRQMARFVGVDAIGQLIAHDLLRLLDALNRRIFKRRDPEAVQVLSFLFRVVDSDLHLFVPKILATLKNALELPGAPMQEAVRQAWLTFLDCLGWERSAPHLGTLFAILGPLLDQQEALAETLLRFMEACAASPASALLDEIFLPSGSHIDASNLLPSSSNGLAQPNQVATARESPMVSLFSTTTTMDIPSVSASLVPKDPLKRTQVLEADEAADVPPARALTAIRALLERRKQQRTPAEQLSCLLPIATTHHSRKVRLLALRELTDTLQRYRSQLYVDLLFHQQSQLVSALIQRGLLVAATDADSDCRQEALAALAILGAIDPARLHLSHDKASSLTVPNGTADAMESASLIDQVVIPTLLEQCLIPALRRVESAQAREWQNRIGFAIQEVLRLAMDTGTGEEPVLTSPRRSLELHSADSCARFAFWRMLSEHAQQIIRPFLHSRYAMRPLAGKASASESWNERGPTTSNLPAASRPEAAVAPILAQSKQSASGMACDVSAVAQISGCSLEPVWLPPPAVAGVSSQGDLVSTAVPKCTRCIIRPGMTAAQWICTFTLHLHEVLDQIMQEVAGCSETPSPVHLDRTHRRWGSLFRACRNLMGHDRNTAVYLLPYLAQSLLQLVSDLDRSGVKYSGQVPALGLGQRAPMGTRALLSDASEAHLLGPSSMQATRAVSQSASVANQSDATAPRTASDGIDAPAGASLGWTMAVTEFLQIHLVDVLSSELNEAIQLVFLLLDQLADQRDRRWMAHIRAVDPGKLSAAEYAALATAAAQQPPQQCPLNALEAGLSPGLLARAAVTSGALHRALLYLDQSKHVLDEVERRLMQRLYRELGEFDAMQAVTVQRSLPPAAATIAHASTGNNPLAPSVSPQPSRSDWECFTLDAEAHHAPDEALIGYEQRLRQCPDDPEAQRGYLQCLQALGLWDTMLTYVLAQSEKKSSLSDLGIEAALRLARWDALETLTESASEMKRGNRAAMVSVAKALGQARVGTTSQVSESLRQARAALSETVAAAALESYARVYPAMVRLHAIADIASVFEEQDLEAVHRYVRDLVSMVPAQGVTNWMQCRLECVSSTWHSRELILAMQRAALLVQAVRCRPEHGEVSPVPSTRGLPGLSTRSSSADRKETWLHGQSGAQPGSSHTTGAYPAQVCQITANPGVHSNAPARASSLRGQCELRPAVGAATIPGHETNYQGLARGDVSEAAQVYREAAHAVTLQLARLARKSGHHAAAMAYLQQISPESLFHWPAQMEQAKIYRARGETRRALAHLPTEGPPLTAPALTWLQQQQQEHPTLGAATIGAQLQSKALCLHAKWMQEDRSAPPQEIIARFQQAVQVQPHAEKVYVLLGRFYDSLTPEQDAMPTARARQQWLYRQLALEHYARSLRYGCRYVYHSLPRLITLWLDEVQVVADDVWERPSPRLDATGTTVIPSHPGSRKSTRARACLATVQENGENDPSASIACRSSRSAAEYFLPLMRKLRARLPLYIWFVVMPQLLSRVTAHASALVRAELRSLLADWVVAYPGQAIWCILPLASALDATRAATGREIIEEARRRGDAALSVLLDSGLELCAQLARFCMQTPARGLRQMTASVHLRGLRRLLRERLQSLAIPVPYQEYLRLLLPTDGRFRDDLHEGFAVNGPTLVDVDEPVLVMNSLMRPKRIGLLASDGRVYPFLCKREDAGDMRKDARMMDLLNVVNRLLAKTAAAQQRRLVLRTYAVLPLNEECGILEWVPHLLPLRGAVGMLHRALGYSTTTEEIRLAYERHAKGNAEVERLAWFTEWLLPRFPPVLRHFYVVHFGQRRSPAAWFAARQAFARSCALWSMVGYLVGLGDRHGENVLIDTQSGACVHVDFACLFDKGLTLKVPETVPFRLTPNMVDAMGAAGFEGVFHRTAQITLSVLRSHRETLLSVLETFLHDPLLDWAAPVKAARTERMPQARDPESSRTKRAADHGKQQGAVTTLDFESSTLERNAQALEMLRVVDRKCQGLHGAQSGTPLSVEGDVARLVAEATNVRNLASMYIWWLPHI